jgi:hypothetical protein
MEYTYHDLRTKTVAQLREVAAGIDHEAVKGHSQMHKDHLISAICAALNIDMHEHHEVHGIDKSALKGQIRSLKKERDELLGKHDPKALKLLRSKIGKLKHKLRKAMV